MGRVNLCVLLLLQQLLLNPLSIITHGKKNHLLWNSLAGLLQKSDNQQIIK
jgi:hypothetical protein